jgi:type II secretory pathway predicted ATPase ExeA
MKKGSSLMTKDEAHKFSAGVAALRERFELSFRQLSDACGGTKAGVSRATAERLVSGKLNVTHASKIKPLVIQNLHNFLRRRGLTEKEATNQLKSISTGEEFKSMLIPKTTLPLNVQQFFNLRRDPFDPSKSDPRDISEAFTSPALERIAAAVEDALNYQGFTAVIGPVGSGKTQMKKRIVEMVARTNGRMRLLFPDFSEMKRVNSGAVVTYVLESFAQKPRRGLVQSFEQMRRHLEGLNDKGICIALAFDEAHRLNDDELSALKNFWELGTGGYQRFLGVILFGQPLFKSRLDDYKFREIAERVEVIDMPEMTTKYAQEYIAHRLRLAGGDIEKLFERKAIELLAAQAETPLALGNLANAALVKAHRLGERRVLASFIETENGQPRVRAMRRAS